MRRLEGKVCIVTGAASGIGAAIAHRLAAEGGRVAIVELNVPGAQDVAREIAAAGGEALALQADVSCNDDVERAVAAVVEKWGGVDVLVNNAGISIAAAEFPETSLGDWERMLSVNLTSQFLCCRTVVPLMLKAGSGSIINISSIVAKNGIGSPAYTASKAGVLGLTRSLSHRFARKGIRVNAVCPGFVWTPMWEGICQRQGRGKEFFDDHVKLHCHTQRPQTPEAVAALVAFLASHESEDITGQALNVTGGAELH